MHVHKLVGEMLSESGACTVGDKFIFWLVCVALCTILAELKWPKGA